MSGIFDNTADRQNKVTFTLPDLLEALAALVFFSDTRSCSLEFHEAGVTFLSVDADLQESRIDISVQERIGGPDRITLKYDYLKALVESYANLYDAPMTWLFAPEDPTFKSIVVHGPDGKAIFVLMPFLEGTRQANP